jgi:hypothetical protein
MEADRRCPAPGHRPAGRVRGAPPAPVGSMERCVDAYVWAHSPRGAASGPAYGVVVVDHAGHAASEQSGGALRAAREDPEGHRHRRPGVADRPHQRGGGRAARVPPRRPAGASCCRPSIRRPSPSSLRGSPMCTPLVAEQRSGFAFAERREWLWCRAHLSALEDSPRFAFTLRPLADPRPSAIDRARELEMCLTRIAHETRAAGLAKPPAPPRAGRPARARHPDQP